MFDGLSPSYTKVINCFCISLESSKGKHALIILYDKCKLWPLRRRWVLDWSIFGRDVESLYNCPTCIRLSPFAVHWPLSGRPITEVRSSGCKISQSQALCLFALFLGFPLSVIVRLRSFNVGVILKSLPPSLLNRLLSCGRKCGVGRGTGGDNFHSPLFVVIPSSCLMRIWELFSPGAAPADVTLRSQSCFDELHKWIPGLLLYNLV